MSKAPDFKRSALVVVDYQNDFCHQDGAVSKIGQDPAPAAAIYPQITDLIEAARQNDLPRIFVRVVHSEWTDTPEWTARGSATFNIPIAREGTWGADFYKIRPRPDELIITKHRYSAFLHTPLGLALRAKGATTIVIAGVQTDVCVHATARDAVQQGVFPIVVEDCVATRDQGTHDRALDDIKTRIGSLAKLSDIQAAWT